MSVWHRFSLAFLSLTLTGFLACNHAAEEARLMGYWEGTLPLPSTGETVPVAYQFRPDGLTVWIGLSSRRIETRWTRWEVAGVQQDDLVVHIYRDDNRVFSSLVREVGDDQLLLWDSGTDLSTAARVRRAEPPDQAGNPPSSGVGEGSGTGLAP